MDKNLIFIHGAGEGKWIWENQTKYFKNSIALDLPGHGDEEDINLTTIEEYADWVCNYIEKRKLNNIVLAGHSMGGAIVMVIALKKPTWLKAIILIATGAKLRVTSVILNSLKKSYEEALKVLSHWSFRENSDFRILLKYKENFLKVPLSVTLRDFLACDKFDYMNKIEKIDYPTLIICGKEDLLTPVKYSQYLKEKIKNSELYIIEEAGHMVMLEKPDEVNRQIEKFLSSI
jgi:Predicted hydrolases or acyltransferases (alpha/beta hydrolase superfamily)